MTMQQITDAAFGLVTQGLAFLEASKFASGLAAAACLAAIVWVLKRWRDRRDSNKIYKYLAASRRTSAYEFRGTATISSETRIPETRVAELASRHKRIRRNTKEKQSWRLAD